MILAGDIGFANFGWAALDKGKVIACGTIKTQKSKKKTVRVADDNASRAAELALELRDLCTKYGVQGVVGELPSGGAQNASAMAKMSMATAVASTVFAMLNLPVEWTTPMEVKKAMTGLRTASKEEMMQTVRERHPYFDFPKTKSVFEHAADAIGAYHALERSGNLIKIFG